MTVASLDFWPCLDDGGDLINVSRTLLKYLRAFAPPRWTSPHFLITVRRENISEKVSSARHELKLYLERLINKQTEKSNILKSEISLNSTFYILISQMVTEWLTKICKFLNFVLHK